MTVQEENRPETDAPEPEILDLTIQMVRAGHHKRVLVRSDLMSFNVHCYAPRGGENGLHAHLQEDHLFLVLEGEAQFYTPKGPLPALRKHQALFLPRGAQYSFANEGAGPLVLARFGAPGLKQGEGRRLDPAGRPIPGRGKQAGAVPPDLVPGAFFR